MTLLLWDIAIYGIYFTGLLTLVFFIALGLEDLWKSWKGRGRRW
ncbi:hypothetical protein ACFWWM_00175 [Streptomyces sp. NPDC058682]